MCSNTDRVRIFIPDMVLKTLAEYPPAPVPKSSPPVATSIYTLPLVAEKLKPQPRAPADRSRYYDCLLEDQWAQSPHKETMGWRTVYGTPMYCSLKLFSFYDLLSYRVCTPNEPGRH